MSDTIQVDFTYLPYANPHWQYHAGGEGFTAVGGGEKFCDAVKDTASAIEFSTT